MMVNKAKGMVMAKVILGYGYRRIFSIFFLSSG